MPSSATKAQFVLDLQIAVNNLIAAKLALADATLTYFKNGFNSGGSNQIADADVASSNLTAAKVGSAITMAQQLANFFGNSAVTTGDYEATVQQLRTT